MQISRKTMVAGAASAYATAGVVRFAASAAEFTYKWGIEFALTHPMGLRAKEAVDKIAQESGGRLEIRLFPSESLGNNASMLTQVRAGALECSTIAGSHISELVPVAGITSVPFIFDSYKQAWGTVDGPCGAYIRDAIRKANLYVFEKEGDAGFHQLVNSVRPVTKPDDLKGMKIGVSPNLFTTYKAFGATPVLNSAQLYVQIQTHLFDGSDIGLTSIDSFKLYEVCKYVSMLNIDWSGLITVANPEAMERLPKNLRNLVETRVNESIVLERNDVARIDSTLVAPLKSRGLAFNQADVAAFKAVVLAAGLYSQWRDQYGATAWAALEKSRGTLQ